MQKKREGEKSMKRSRNYLQRLSLILLFWVCLFGSSRGAAVQAASSGEYAAKVNGTVDYTKAYEVLNYVNQERKSAGKSALTMDQELLDSAMQRAAECSVYFNHIRPDGTWWYTVSSRAYGENIAAGYESAKNVFQGWKNSPGHYENMMNGGYQNTGIGCFKVGDVTWWVQLFGYEKAEPVTKKDTAKKTVRIANSGSAADELEFNLNQAGYAPTDTRTVRSGTTEQLKVGRRNTNFYGAYTEFVGNSFQWKSSNTSVLRVDANGKVTAVGPGKATVTATPKTIYSGKVTPASVKYQVTPCSHKYGAWKTTKAPTVFETGIKERTCSLCKKVQKGTIAKVTPVLELSRENVTMKKGALLTIQVSKKGAGDEVASWKSSDKTIATVTQGGRIKAIKPGNATITCTMKSGISKEVKVRVVVLTTKLEVPSCTKGVVKAGKLTLPRGTVTRLKVNRLPSDVTDRLTFKSSNTKIVWVSESGTLNAKKKGSAKITVKSGSKSVTITVTVK